MRERPAFQPIIHNLLTLYLHNALMAEAYLENKNRRLFNALSAPELYTRHFSEKQDTITLRQGMSMRTGTDRQTWQFETLSEVDNKDTGLRASVLIDRSTGHAIVLYKGMDMPLRDEGNGRFAFLKDAKTAIQSWIYDGENQQTKQAEQLYLDTVDHPDVKSVEVIGFSLGTLHANYVTAKYDAKSTVLADLGLSKDGLTKIFNERASNDSNFNLSSLKNNMAENMTVLRLKADLVPALFGEGPSRGKIIDLDKGDYPDLKGMSHLSSIYNRSAQYLEEQVIMSAEMQRQPSPTMAAPVPA
jgi:hypothetical protein